MLRRRLRCRPSNGFSLIEVLLAVLLMGSALSGLGHLIVLAVRANASARASTMAVALATQKMEELRAGVDWEPIGGSIQVSVAGFSDTLDDRGAPAGNDAAFVRRWSVEPLPSEPLRSRVLRVRVVHVAGAADRVPPWPARGVDDTRLLTVATARER